uniref:Protein piccolo (inferred by orthology to a human protein) n=1 Tax=Anisakis simplex TaxID=6269 RepID=A0A0M3KC45_ANISI
LKGSYHKEAPPIPAHRCVDGRASPSFDYQSSKNALLDSVPLKATISRHNRTSTFEVSLLELLRNEKRSFNSWMLFSDFIFYIIISMRFRETVSDLKKPESLGYLNVALSYNRLSSTLFVTVLSARGLSYRQYSSTAFYPNPFVKIYLLPGRKVSNKRRTKFVPNTCDPVWNQTVEYMIPMQELYGHYLEFTVWDYDKINDNNSLGQVVISLSEPYVLNGVARWYPLQALHHNFAVSGLPGVQFDTAIGTVNRSYNTSQYNPGTVFLCLSTSAIRLSTDL